MASRDVLALLLKNSLFLYMKNDFGLDNTSVYTCLGIPAKSGYLLYDPHLPYLATYFCPMVGWDQGQDQVAAQPVSSWPDIREIHFQKELQFSILFPLSPVRVIFIFLRLNSTLWLRLHLQKSSMQISTFKKKNNNKPVFSNQPIGKKYLPWVSEHTTMYKTGLDSIDS